MCPRQIQMGFQQMLVYPCLITSNYSAKQPQESTRADIHLVPLQGGSSQAVKLECKSRGVNVTVETTRRRTRGTTPFMLH